MRKFGLIGKKLGHSFSKNYFTEKFSADGITDAVYNLYELDDITKLPSLIESESIRGLNVTIPYKESLSAFLDELDESAINVGAVNVISIGDKIIGYNTDYFGFLHSLMNWVDSPISRALILGTGGASKAVAAALQSQGINFDFVSRSSGYLTYKQLRENKSLDDYQLVVNTTPLGMSPNSDTFPDLDYDLVHSKQYFYDLVYNPDPTVFMKKAGEKGARTKGGLEMLHLQAEKSWEIWNS